MARLSLVLPLVLVFAAATCDAGSPQAPPDGGGPPPGPKPPGAPSDDLVPLIDLGTGQYLGRYEGGLYPGGADEPPTDHLLSGFERARRIQPLDAQGRPDPAGKIVLLSIGMSNAADEFCGHVGIDCGGRTFAGQAQADPVVDHEHLVIVNGAQSGVTAGEWDLPRDEAYDVVRTSALVPNGLDERQVQIVWLKQANPRPSTSLPAPAADAFALERDLGEIVRSLTRHYPNVELVFLSSRTYGGYATTDLNPEPYAYESGFAVKWLVEAQINQERTAVVDPVAGDLDLDLYPWIGWGPYLWTEGAEGRSDGLEWLPQDVRDDGTHPGPLGVEKVGDLLLDFFKTSPVARCWFLAGLDCGN